MNGCCVDTLIAVKASPSLLLRWGSASALPTSGWRATAQAVPLSTVGRVLKALGPGRLKNLQPAEPVRRYQWARPDDMIHVDT